MYHRSKQIYLHIVGLNGNSHRGNLWLPRNVSTCRNITTHTLSFMLKKYNNYIIFSSFITSNKILSVLINTS